MSQTIAENKIWTAEEIRENISTKIHWLERAICAVHRYQSEDEQTERQTKYKNGIGFNGPDSRFLSTLAEEINKGLHLTPVQVEVARAKMVKYSKQLAKIANKIQ